MKTYQSLTIIALLLVSAPIASAQILNGSFENSTGVFDIAFDNELGLGGVDNLGSATSWTFGLNAGISVGATTDGGAAAWLSPSFGTDAVVSQTFSLTNAGSFSLSWDSFSADPLFSPVGAVFSYNVDLTEVGGASIFNSNFVELSDGLATSHSVPLNASSGQYNLTFTGASTGDTFIDNVTVVAVPEPGSSLLTMLAGLGLFTRRRRA